MTSQPRSPYAGLVITLAVLIILADQLTKAWFVYTQSNYKLLHPQASFAAFSKDYFTRFDGVGQGSGTGRHTAGLVTLRYGGIDESSHDKMVWDPWIRFHLTTNSGAAWSLFAGNSFILSFVSLGIALVLLLFWNRAFRYNLAMSWATGAILGGALGNFLDRFRFKEVVDFIFCRIPLIGRIFPKLGDPYPFPIFNVADACAVCGTIALALYLAGLDGGESKRKRLEEARASDAAWKPYPGGMNLDQDAVAKVHELDTTSLPAWQEPGPEEDEQALEAKTLWSGGARIVPSTSTPTAAEESSNAAAPVTLSEVPAEPAADEPAPGANDGSTADSTPPQEP